MAKKRTGKMPVLRVNTDFFPQKHFHNFHDFHDFLDSAGSGCKPVIPAFQLLLPLEVSSSELYPALNLFLPILTQALHRAQMA